MLVKGKKKEQVEEVDGDPYRYFLLAGTTRPYPDDTFYSVGRVPRKLLMKYLGIKMYLVRSVPPSQHQYHLCRYFYICQTASSPECDGQRGFRVAP